MSLNTPVRVGIIGLGFMGRTHLGAYLSADKAGLACAITALADPCLDESETRSPSRGNIRIDTAVAVEDAIRSAQRYTNADDLLANPDVDLVSITTHTDSHADLAIAALEAGKHVLIEKPVARTAEDVKRVVDAAQRSDRIVMPAMCIRFWPAWAWLKAQVESGAFGAVRSASFHRLASPPTWATEFYRDEKRSGAALVDLHIHDADFIRHLLGEPTSVVSTGSVDHLTTMYRFADGPTHVVAHGGWDYAPGFDFQMRYLVNFDDATIEYHSSKDPQITIYRASEREGITLGGGTGYEHEIRHLLECIHGRVEGPKVTLADAYATALLLDAERRSLLEQREIELA